MPTKKPTRPPFAFVLDELDALEPFTKPMFGCTAVYVGDRIVLILRERPTRKDDNGVWRGKANQNGKAVNVSVDFQGNVLAQ